MSTTTITKQDVVSTQDLDLSVFEDATDSAIMSSGSRVTSSLKRRVGSSGRGRSPRYVPRAWTQSGQVD